MTFFSPHPEISSRNTDTLPARLKSSVREEKISLNPLRFCDRDLKIKLTKARVTEKRTNFIHVRLQKLAENVAQRTWGLSAILTGDEERGERALMEKGVTWER